MVLFYFQASTRFLVSHPGVSGAHHRTLRASTPRCRPSFPGYNTTWTDCHSSSTFNGCKDIGNLTRGGSRRLGAVSGGQDPPYGGPPTS